MELRPYVRASHEFLPRDGNHADSDLFSLCVFRTENIGGVAASRGGWRKSPYVGMSINPSVARRHLPYLELHPRSWTKREYQ